MAHALFDFDYAQFKVRPTYFTLSLVTFLPYSMILPIDRLEFDSSIQSNYMKSVCKVLAVV